jgi:hypothetical protein
MSFKEGLFASPFNTSDDEIDPNTEKGKEVLSQPPATKWELWGYYLYYNGVKLYRDRDNKRKEKYSFVAV